LLDYAIHRRQNETRSRKSTRVNTMLVHSAMSRGRLIQWAFGSVTLASPLIFFTKAVSKIIVRELSEATPVCSYQIFYKCVFCYFVYFAIVDRMYICYAYK
jgi:hypothetical protein